MLAGPTLPKRIERLSELADNLWWSWHPVARELFRALDYSLWKSSGHNPVKQLVDIASERLSAASDDPLFLRQYDSVMSEFDEDMATSRKWFPSKHHDRLDGPVAFFSMEFAIHNSLRTYAGGLGILAGDICKEASDLGLPLVGIVFMYPKGYFHQHIGADGWQAEIDEHLSFDEAPINPVLTSEGSRLVLGVQLGDRPLAVAVWKVQVGRTTVYLLDTDVEGNLAQDRQLASHLYTTGREQRIAQEIVLGVAGVRALRALGVRPSVWHANEGHTAFMMLERIREHVEAGVPFAEAARRVRASTVFTTHTPVPAGTEVFSPDLVERYLHGWWESVGIGRDTFFELARSGVRADQGFNMSALGLRLSDHRNAVSRLHAQVARRMWVGLWPDEREDRVPIEPVTNGVHVPTWLAPELGLLYDAYLGEDWLERQDEAELWDRVSDIPDNELWDVRRELKRKLIAALLQRAQKSWRSGELTAEQLMMMGTLLDVDALTIGFARRFATYKRATLMFEDTERLERIVTSPSRPVQIVFAGKAHPADFEAKHLIQKVYSLAKDRRFQGRIAFVEDYDMHLAHFLTQGVDLWLNTPVLLAEACGTSGMKAVLNGVPHLSVPGGWWYEGYNGNNGWMIGERPADALRDRSTAEAMALYRILEEQVVPLYYQRDRRGVPHGWIRLVKEAVRSVVPAFCARRMVKEYATQMYLPAARALGD
ncbi:MAG: alpha-glucan family phosphorylase [Chloroflexota bacterium]|nr:alpha-glucan family phosphorylase [Chloroflexota bacterium]